MLARTTARVVLPSVVTLVLSTILTSVTLRPSSVELGTPALEQRIERAVEQDRGASLDASNSMSGRVVDAKGEPLADVLVWCEPGDEPYEYSFSDHGLPLHLRSSLEEHVEAARSSWQHSLETTRTATTGPDGRFVLGPLEHDRVYDVTAKSGDAVVTAYEIGKKRAGDDFTIATKAQRRVRLEVVDRSGQRLEGAMIHVKREMGSTGHWWTPEDDEIVTTETAVALTARVGTTRRVQAFPPAHQDLPELSSDPVSVDVTTIGDEVVRLVVEEPTWLEIDLDDPWLAEGGDGRRGVFVVPIEDGGVIDVDDPRYRGGGLALRDRRAVLLDVEPGLHAVVLRVDHDRVVLARTVAIEPGANTVTISVPPPAFEGHVLVRVRDSLGNGRPEADVALEQFVDGRWLVASERQALRHADGTYRVRTKDVRDERTALRVLVRDRDLGYVTVEGEPDQREFEVEYLAPGSLRVEFTGYADSNLKGRELVEMRLERGSDGSAVRYGVLTRLVGYGRRSFVDAEGVLDLHALAPGTWRLAVKVRGGPLGQVPIFDEEVEVLPGERGRLEIPYPNLVPVSLDGPADLAGTRFLVVPDSVPLPEASRPHRVGGDLSSSTVFVLDAAGDCEIGELPESGFRIAPLDASDRVIMDAVLTFDVQLGTETIRWPEAR